MASGSFTGTTSNGYIKPTITWSSTKNIAGNYSDVTATLTYSRTNSGYTTSGKFSGSITINGTTTSGSTSEQIYITQNSNTFAMKATTRVSHNADGKKSITISATGSLSGGGSLTSTTISGTVTLDTIPRQATITSAPNFTDHDNPTIEYSNPAGNAATELMACISFTGSKDDIAYRAIDKTKSSYQFELTDAERNTLRTNTSGSSRKLFFYVRTKFGTTTFYERKEVTFSIKDDADSKPSIMLTTSLDNGSLPDKFDNLCIQGKSRYDVTLSAEGKYGASVTSLYATLEGTTYNYSQPFKTNAIQYQSTTEIVTYAKDSRGFSNDARQQIIVIPYSKPLVVPVGDDNAILCYRSDSSGIKGGKNTSVWIKAKMTFSSVNDINQCALQWRRKESNAVWDDSVHRWNDLLPEGSSEDTFNALIPATSTPNDNVFEKTKSYTVQIRAIDDIGEYDIKTFEIPTEDVALHLGHGGKNVSIGGYCDTTKEHTFTSEWDSYFKAGVFIEKDQTLYTLEDFIKEVIKGG